MSHTKKSAVAKLKRKIVIGDKLADAKIEAKLRVVEKINEYLDTLVEELEGRTDRFQKEIHKMNNKIERIKEQEEKAAMHLAESQKKLLAQGTPAAKKRLKAIKAANLKLSKDSLDFNRTLIFLEDELIQLRHKIHHISTLRKAIKSA